MQSRELTIQSGRDPGLTDLTESCAGFCAEVADDHVLASVDDRLLAWREIEVELGPAARSMPRRLTKRLIEAGAKPGRYPSKLARVSPTTRPEAAGGTAAGRAVASYLTEQIDNIFDGDLGLRRGSTPFMTRGSRSAGCAAPCGCSAS